MTKTAFLKEKTDAECRQLAAHYYVRARKAEKERDEVKAKLYEADRLIGEIRGDIYTLVATIDQQER